MKVILKVDVKGKGQKGDLIKVSDGYARNYLLPRDLAVEATKSNLNILSRQKKAEANKKEIELNKAKELAAKLSDITVEVKAKAGETGKLFGSITAIDIAEYLKKQHNIDIDRRKLGMEEPIRSLGVTVIEAKIYPEVSASIKVNVTEEV